MSVGTPEAEVSVDEALVRELLLEQHSDLADRPLRFVEAGFDNFMFRLGSEHVVRLPRRETSADLIRNEQRCLPLLAPKLPLPIPAPIRTGVPSTLYPWHWSVLPWLPGRAADEEAIASDQAIPFAAFLRALHRPAAADAPDNPFRGCPLADRAEPVGERLVRLREKTSLITSAVEQTWQTALAAAASTEALWIHGDLHARNTLVEGGKIIGIIDWGDVTSGDAATDLASIWGLFEEPSARREAIETYKPDADLLCRAKGWAVSFGALLLDTGLVDHPRHAVMGEDLLRRIAEDSGK